MGSKKLRACCCPVNGFCLLNGKLYRKESSNFSMGIRIGLSVRKDLVVCIEKNRREERGNFAIPPRYPVFLLGILQRPRGLCPRVSRCNWNGPRIPAAVPGDDVFTDYQVHYRHQVKRTVSKWVDFLSAQHLFVWAFANTISIVEWP